jgi:pimeloyl-ACP methyl ester carboxylesterase
LRDQLRAWLGREPVMLDVVGPPGALAAMTTPDAEPGYRAIVPPDWVDQVCARIVLRLGTYRPGRGVGRIACPVLFCVCDDDAVTPPGPAVAAAGRAPRGELRRYPGGHFDAYVGELFERIVAEQTGFLTEHLLAAEREPVAA